jgi:hypothetical protein
MDGCDSQVLVKAIYFSSLRGKTLVEKIKSLLELDWKVVVKYFYREVNQYADALANYGCLLALRSTSSVSKP